MITALAIDPNCTQGHCRLWLAAAGGGVWRTDKALHGQPALDVGLRGLPSNAIGTLTYARPTRSTRAPARRTQPPTPRRASASSSRLTAATPGRTCRRSRRRRSRGLHGRRFKDRSINSVVVDPANPNVLYVGSMSGLRGISSVLSAGVIGAPAPLPGPWCLQEHRRRQTFTYLNGATLAVPAAWSGERRARPVGPRHRLRRRVRPGHLPLAGRQGDLDADLRARNPANAAVIERDSLAVTTLPNGKTRMYVGAGDNGTFAARLYRTDDATAATPRLHQPDDDPERRLLRRAVLVRQRRLLAAGPARRVYLGGSYDYDNAGVPVLGGDTGKRTNGRAFIYSTDAGANFSDLTRDAAPAGSQDGMHPDQHAIAISPTNPNIVFFGSDGGVMRSSGELRRHLGPVRLARAECRRPRRLQAAPVARADLVRQPERRPADAAVPEPLGRPERPAAPPGRHAGQWHLGRLRRRPGVEPDDLGRRRPVRLQRRRLGSALQHVHGTGERCELPRWRSLEVGRITGDIVQPRGRAVLPAGDRRSEPGDGRLDLPGLQSIWRTQDWGGDRDFLEAHCSEFTTSSADTNCGDFQRIGPAGNRPTAACAPLAPGRLERRRDRAGGERHRHALGGDRRPAASSSRRTPTRRPAP